MTEELTSWSRNINIRFYTFFNKTFLKKRAERLLIQSHDNISKFYMIYSSSIIDSKSFYFYELILLISFFHVLVIDSLSNINVRIPEFIQTGESADLTCSFNLGGDDLYSVKWYKGRHEFYRYMPNEKPKIKIFPVKGMKINVSKNKQYLTISSWIGLY